MTEGELRMPNNVGQMTIARTRCPDRLGPGLDFMQSFFFDELRVPNATEPVCLESKSSETRVFCVARLNRSGAVDPVKDRGNDNDACSLPNALKNWGGFARH